MKISILSPAYQSEDTIEDFLHSLYQDVVSPLRKKNYHCEVIIAEDGSTDTTREILKRARKQFGYTLVLGEKRRGYIQAVKHLYSVCSGDCVFFLDSDGEVHPKHFWRLFAEWEKRTCDIVTAYKTKRKPFYRWFISRCNNTLLRLLFQTSIRDANAGFRIYTRSIGKELVIQSGYLKYNFNAEQIIRAVRKGYRIAEIPVPHHERKSVVFVPSSLPKTVLKAFGELLRFRLAIHRL